MKLSELIEKAREMQRQWGDVEVLVNGYFKGDRDNAHGFHITAYSTFENDDLLVPDWFETRLKKVTKLAVELD